MVGLSFQVKCLKDVGGLGNSVGEVLESGMDLGRGCRVLEIWRQDYNFLSLH